MKIKFYMQKQPIRHFVACLLSLALLTANAQKTPSLTLLKQYVMGHQQQLGISAKDIDNLLVTRDYKDASTGIQHIYSVQKLNGLTITGSSFSLHVTDVAKTHASRLVPLGKYKVLPATAAVGATTAIATVMDAVGYTADKTVQVKQAAQGTDKYTVYKRNDSPVWDIPVRMVYYESKHLHSLLPAWEVQMMDVYKRHYWLAYVDANSGKLLEKRDLIVHCSYDGAPTDEHPSAAGSVATTAPEGTFNLTMEEGHVDGAVDPLPKNKYRVYNLPFENPIDPGAKHVVSARAGDTLASPDGWHRVNGSVLYNYSHGNNVWAFQDPSPGPLGGVPSADPTRTAYPTNSTIAGTYPVTQPFVFDYPIDLNSAPSAYQNAAIVNLFYWNNLLHDVYYYMGFNEEAGNFEESHVFVHSTKGDNSSLANDNVLAQAQDGGGTNNANMLTLPDGTNPQMQMYLWTAATPDSMVHILSSSTGTPNEGVKYFAVQGSFGSLPTSNTNLFTNPVVSKELAIGRKNALAIAGGETEGCSTGQQSIALPMENVEGKIAVVDRGSCSFAEKVLGAQEGGAEGVIVINNVDGPPQAMGASDGSANLIRIPAVMISKADGAILKAELQAGATIIGSLRRTAPPPPNRDGDLDNGVIAHEYGHGISNRLTGGPMALGPLGGDEQGGEGWSDFIALYMTLRQNDLKAATAKNPNGVLPTRSIGNYVTYQPFNGRGIRNFPYSTKFTDNPATFSYIQRPEYTGPHPTGFVWCTMLYEMLQNFIDQYGMSNNVYESSNPTAQHNPPASAKGNNIAMRLIIEGMKLQPTGPTFVEQRDAILKADSLLYNAQHSCLIWKAFAKRGLGFSAVSGTNGKGDEVESFDLPFACDPNQKRINIAKSGPVTAVNGKNLTYTITVRNIFPRVLSNVIIEDTLPSRLRFVSATGSPVQNGNIVKWTANIPASGTVQYTVTAKVKNGAAATLAFAETQDTKTSQAAWTRDQSATAVWMYKTDASQAYSGKKYWFVTDYDLGGSNTSLRTTNPIAVPSGAELVFIHKYATEDGYDGGVVEISNDGGATWNYLPPSKFVQNNYSGLIPLANNPHIGTEDRLAFTGTSPGYVTSIAKLDDYSGQQILVRFRMMSDEAGGSVDGGGWWLDNVYVMANRTELSNTAYGETTAGTIATPNEGTNAFSATLAFITNGAPATTATLEAAPTAKSVELNWQTTEAAAGTLFEIERKSAADESFQMIGTLQPTGEELSTGKFRFNDANAVEGASEYRIRVMGAGLDTLYTNIAMVKLGSNLSARLYPNPVKDVAHVAISNPAAADVFLSIFDVNGRRLATLKGGNFKGSRVIDLPVQHLTSGTYWIEVKNSVETVTVPMIIKK